MDLVKCSKYRCFKSCCGEKAMESKNEVSERNKDFMLTRRRNKIEDVQSSTSVIPTLTTNIQNECYNDFSKVPFSWTARRASSMYLPFSELSRDTKDQASSEYFQDDSFSSFKTGDEKGFRCPRCSNKMQEPRLLPCLHPICSPCVSELMSKRISISSKDKIHEIQANDRTRNFYETCPLCEFQLPNSNSTIPPPHYPLQHRLVMEAVRCRLANRVLCDACSDEVVAVVQCSTCLRNFCSDCGMEHQQQITMELRPSKHSVKPLWEATKVRRTALCQKHPTHALRFYCIACQQVTCKECMWTIQHRGHASEDAIGAGKRAALYLTAMLQRAKALLNILLTQYDQDVFSNDTRDELQDICIPSDYRYVESIVFIFSFIIMY